MQTTMFSTGDVDAARAPSPYLDDPTAVVVSVSGGLDSSAAAIWARRRWPDRPLIVLFPVLVTPQCTNLVATSSAQM